MAIRIKKFDGISKAWLPLAAAIVIMSGLVYLAVQQNLRQSANDPQIQLAEDAAHNLSNGTFSASVLSAIKVDPSESLAPFMMVFDQSGKVVVSGIKLGNQSPTPPSGVFSFVKAHGEDRFTWQPQPGVRLAAVLVPYHSASDSGYVLAARSIKEVEKRESQAYAEAVAFGLFALGASLLLALILN